LLIRTSYAHRCLSTSDSIESMWSVGSATATPQLSQGIVNHPVALSTYLRTFSALGRDVPTYSDTGPRRSRADSSAAMRSTAFCAKTASSWTTKCQSADGSRSRHAEAPVVHSSLLVSHAIWAPVSAAKLSAHSRRRGWAMMATETFIVPPRRLRTG